jgi:predicted DsbA family dithiol-disulfide isomerase
MVVHPNESNESGTQTAAKARLTVFSDYVCPFCYLEEPDIAAVRDAYGERVEIDHRAYELRPDPVPTLDPDGEYLHRVWDTAVYPIADALGMTLRLPPVQPRSRRALEAAEYAREERRFSETHDALFRALFQDGRDLNDSETLLEIGAAAGLDEQELRRALDEGRYTEKVVADEELAKRLGVFSVPTVLVGRSDLPLEEAEAVVGTQTGNERLKKAVERVLREGDENSP